MTLIKIRILDKARNLYETTKKITMTHYNREHYKNVQRKQPKNKTINKISREALAESFDNTGRVDCSAKFDTFITLKYHKERPQIPFRK